MNLDSPPARFYAHITWSVARLDTYTSRQVTVRFGQLNELLDLALDLRPLARTLTVCLHNTQTDEDWAWEWSDTKRIRARGRRLAEAARGRP